MKARILALYLPQYHPIPENDLWWGKGFTEWSNVTKAKPLFRGHYQPKLPRDLGFYDLRLPEIREEQARLAKASGVEGFIYWHYWFGNGKRLLERPFNEVLESGKPDFPFALAWANHTWSTKTWKSVIGNEVKQKTIVEQTYPGISDYTDHFYFALRAFRDKRYIRVDGKPVFFVYNPNFDDVMSFINIWESLALQNGLRGIHFVAMVNTASLRNTTSPEKRIQEQLIKGFNAVNTIGNTLAEIKSKRIVKYFKAALAKYLNINLIDRYDQEVINNNMFTEVDQRENVYPTIMPNWDRTPRCGKQSTIYTNSTPDVFKRCLERVTSLIDKKDDEHKIIILKSWNEWGEGNYVEPDMKYGTGYLDAIRNVLK